MIPNEIITIIVTVQYVPHLCTSHLVWHLDHGHHTHKYVECMGYDGAPGVHVNHLELKCSLPFSSEYPSPPASHLTRPSLPQAQSKILSLFSCISIGFLSHLSVSCTWESSQPLQHAAWKSCAQAPRP